MKGLAKTGPSGRVVFGKSQPEDGRVAKMECLPESLRGRRYYHPSSEGREKLLAQRMEEIRKLRDAK